MMGLGFFPGVCESSEWQEEPARMYGEVYSVTPEVLHSLDLLEGHPHFYKRVKVRTSEGTRVWVYILQDTYNPERAVESGLWHPTEEEAAFWSSKEDASDAAA
jgi:gamma-glutamylcyclotransferase (GGCT)/AIG2-like uncharacterized protein YtfP